MIHRQALKARRKGSNDTDQIDIIEKNENIVSQQKDLEDKEEEIERLLKEMVEYKTKFEELPGKKCLFVATCISEGSTETLQSKQVTFSSTSSLIIFSSTSSVIIFSPISSLIIFSVINIAICFSFATNTAISLFFVNFTKIVQS